jgi:hypothetical protein
MLYSLECHGNLLNVISSVGVHSNSTNIFQCAGVADSFDIFYSYNIQNSSSVRFSSNLVGCTHCFACSNLTNQSYCIENITYPKDEYLAKVSVLFQEKEQYGAYMQSLDRSQPALL